MTDPPGSDRIEEDVPTTSATGDNSDLGSDVEGVPLTRNEAIERDAAQPDELPARLRSDVGLTERADPDGSA
jgi:hypothetical protein